MIEEELDLVQVWNGYIGLNPNIGTVRRHPRGVFRRSDPPQADIILWMRLGEVDRILHAEDHPAPLTATVYLPRPNRHHLEEAVLEIDADDERTFLDALMAISAAIASVRRGDVRGRITATLLRIDKREPYVATRAERADMTPLPRWRGLLRAPE